MNGKMHPAAAARASAAFSSAREGITSARLEFPRGAARLTIEGEEIPELFRARFGPPVPSVAVDDGTITATYPRISPRSWIGPWRARRGWVALSTEVAWALSIRGVVYLDADLRDLRIERIDLARGASHLEIRLPRPSGIVPVRVSAGVTHMTVGYPAGTAARLRVGRGVAHLRFEEQEFGAVGGALRLESPDAGRTEDRYDIEISRGAAHVWIAADEPTGKK
jgi:hypothetical protein